MPVRTISRAWQRWDRPNSAAAWLVAAFGVTLATIVRVGIADFIDSSVTFTTYYPAVMIAALLGGLRPGTVTLLGSGFIAWALFLPPGETVLLALFLLMGALIVGFAWLFRRMAEQVTRDGAHLGLLMREVDHRAKNLLTVVQAMMQLTKAGTAEEFVTTVSGRIDALARAHDAVARSGWTAADLATLVAREMEAFGIAGRTRAAGPSVLLGAEAVQAFAIIVHELATNAVKYGCLTAPTGRLDIGWEINRRGGLHFTWSEHGDTAIAPPQRSGIGTMMIDTMVRQQVDGAIDRQWLADGLRVEITIPGNHLWADIAPPEPRRRHGDPAGSARPAVTGLLRTGRLA